MCGQTNTHAHIMGLKLMGKRWGKCERRVRERVSVHERAHMLTCCCCLLMHMELKKSWSIYCSSRIDESVCTHIRFLHYI